MPDRAQLAGDQPVAQVHRPRAPRRDRAGARTRRAPAPSRARAAPAAARPGRPPGRQDRRVAPDALAQLRRQAPQLRRGLDVAGEEDEAPGLGRGEERALGRRERRAGAAEDDGARAHLLQRHRDAVDAARPQRLAHLARLLRGLEARRPAAGRTPARWRWCARRRGSSSPSRSSLRATSCAQALRVISSLSKAPSWTRRVPGPTVETSFTAASRRGGGLRRCGDRRGPGARDHEVARAIARARLGGGSGHLRAASTWASPRTGASGSGSSAASSVAGSSGRGMAQIAVLGEDPLGEDRGRGEQELALRRVLRRQQRRRGPRRHRGLGHRRRLARRARR